MENNFTDAIETVIFTMGAFEEMCRARLPRTGVIFDQQLSYETGLEAYLEKNDFNKDSTVNKPDNLLIYQRTVIEDSLEGAASRVKQQTTFFDIDGERLRLKPISGEFDINFIYAAHQIEDIYKFETYYAANIGFGDKEIVTNLANLGDSKYYLKYLPLTDIQASSGSPDVTYKMVGGTIRVRGIYFVVTGSVKGVAKFRLRLFDERVPRSDSILLATFLKTGTNQVGVTSV